MDIVIFDQNHFYANGLKHLINQYLSPGGRVAINDGGLLGKAHLVIRTPAFSSREEWQSAFNNPNTLYIYQRPTSEVLRRRGNALYRCDPLNITLDTLERHLNGGSEKQISPPTFIRSLTAAEIRLLKLIKLGWKDHRIAANYQLNPKAISMMRCNAMKKMGLRNRLELYQLLNKLNF
ncbi:LuxR C-terminal-related transcriptional regulator [Serratia sp. L9]|uniref:LuxR C-terminal-related transcriptional regulator n=1 Tax=Serratia sp. L9 TaxID=3423946 RepID=UPI003D66D558